MPRSTKAHWRVTLRLTGGRAGKWEGKADSREDAISKAKAASGQSSAEVVLVEKHRGLDSVNKKRNKTSQRKYYVRGTRPGGGLKGAEVWASSPAEATKKWEDANPGYSAVRTEDATTASKKIVRGQ